MTGIIQVIGSLATEGEGGEGITEGGYVAPGPAEFDLPPLFHIGSFEFTKPMAQLFLAAILVFWFFWAASRNRAMVPGRLQFAGESAYGMVRNSMARDIIGSHDFMRFVPYLVALFFFILVNNLFGSIPGIQFPTFSRASLGSMYPSIADEAVSLHRDSYKDGGGKSSVSPDGIKVQSMFQCDTCQVPGVSGRGVYSVLLDFDKVAFDFGEQLTLSCAQARLIGAGRRWKQAPTAYPVA